MYVHIVHVTCTVIIYYCIMCLIVWLNAIDAIEQIVIQDIAFCSSHVSLKILYSLFRISQVFDCEFLRTRNSQSNEPHNHNRRTENNSSLSWL